MSKGKEFPSKEAALNKKLREIGIGMADPSDKRTYLDAHEPATPDEGPAPPENRDNSSPNTGNRDTLIDELEFEYHQFVMEYPETAWCRLIWRAARELRQLETKCSLLSQDLESVRREAKIFRDAAEGEIAKLRAALEKLNCYTLAAVIRVEGGMANGLDATVLDNIIRQALEVQ